MSEEALHQVVIVGSGPAGCTAAIYAARAERRPFMFEGFSTGGMPGGQLMTTTTVENFPGFPEPVNAPELMMRMKEQAKVYGATSVMEDVVGVDLSEPPFLVEGTQTKVRAHALIVATGAVARRLGLPGEDRLWGKGVSACAVCDGGLPIFRGRVLAVVGGGDTACEEALYLSRFAGKVRMLVRRDVLRASKIMQEAVEANDKIEVLWKTSPLELLGDDALEGVRVRDNDTGEERDLEFGGLFYAVGHKPNTEFLNGRLELDEHGYIATRCPTTRTSVEGVFAGGDVADPVYRQAVTAAGGGCKAAIEADRWLTEKGVRGE